MQRAADINFTETGANSDSGHVVICMHGIGGNSDSFAPQLEAFTNKARVITWNMPGYGGSKRLTDTSFETLAQSLLALMDALSISRAHLVGQSIGGMIAQEFALRYPERVESLALIATTSAFGGRDDSFKAAFLEARLAPLEAGELLADLAHEFVPQIVGPQTDDEIIAAAVRSMAVVPEASYKDILTCLVTFNRRHDIAGITQPCCLIAGSVDTNAPARTMEKMSTVFPDARYHCIEGAGHLVNLEAPDLTNAYLADFWGL